jgi:hypothetical protein
MASAIAFIQWENYVGGPDEPGLFAAGELTFNSRQARLHSLEPGDHLWLVSRCPDDQQYYFLAVLQVAAPDRNPPDSQTSIRYGEFAVIADPGRSHDLGRRFPAEGLLRALEFEPRKPILYGASIGQSLQSLRSLSPQDEAILAAALNRLRAGESPLLDTPFALWTKCDAVFAGYFLKNWQARAEPLAFLLYDSPPVLSDGAPVFIHSDKQLRLVARYRGSQFVAGHKGTVPNDERLVERERVWTAYRAATIDPPSKPEFDHFWEQQNGVRALFLMVDVVTVPSPLPFKSYGRALEWGYPLSVGHRYLTLSQSALLLRATGLPDEVAASYLAPLLHANRSSAQEFA